MLNEDNMELSDDEETLIHNLLEKDYCGFLREMNNKCYFCDFKEAIHQHHIMPLSAGGLNEPDNIIGLCPNHHALIHKRVAYLVFNGKHYFLRRHDDGKVYLPTWEQEILHRNAPWNSIKTCNAIGVLKTEGL